MTRPVFGKVRTIVIPVPLADETLTLGEYEEKYGIDLLNVFDVVLENDYIHVHGKNPMDLILFTTLGTDMVGSLIPFNSECQPQKWTSGSYDGFMAVGGCVVNDSHDVFSTIGIVFTIPKDKSFDKKNIEISRLLL